MIPMDDDRLVCFHEAGHAVVCHTLGGKVNRLELNATGGTMIFSMNGSWDDFGTILAAGVCAEFLVTQWNDFGARKEKFIHRSSGRGDLAAFREKVKTGLTWEGAFDRALGILGKRLTRLFVLADRLEKFGYIEADEVAAVMPICDAIGNRALTGGRNGSRAGVIRQPGRRWSALGLGVNFQSIKI